MQLSLLNYPEFLIQTKFVKLQKNENEIIPCSINSIKKHLPQLYTDQHEDVLKAEIRFYEQNKKGILFTNDTGTGKTFVGLGIAKRHFLMDVKNILIVTPTDKKCKDWVDDGKLLGLNIYQLESIIDFKKGIITTTYSNFYQNEKLLEYHFGLIIYDECHRLIQNEKGSETVFLDKHWTIGRFPSVYRRNYISDIEYKNKYPDKVLKDMTNWVLSTRIIFLSASPFAYIKSLVLGDGTLWNIHEEISIDAPSYDSNGYNSPGPEQKFYIENFGYSMRYGKLTRPDVEVNIGLMERNFYDKQLKIGSISGRRIEVEKDYSRDFVLIDSEIGNKIDEGIALFYEKDIKNRYPILTEFYHRKFRFHYVNQLLESIKAKLSIERIIQHLNLGRKVVLFHNFNNITPGHPFKFSIENLLKSDEYYRYSYELSKEIKKYESEFSQYVNMDLSDLVNPISTIRNFFGDRCGQYNGTIPKKRRNETINSFMSDLSGLDIILIQREAGKEGISLHDTTGIHQRALLDLGLPTRPTDAIQTEGRTYRRDLLSNAIFEYIVIHTNFEQNAYAYTIATRSRTAENLAKGNEARNMETIFKDGYMNSRYFEPYEGQGIGGKETDKIYYEIDDFQKAITFYYSNQKKNSKNRSREGLDYFATPEPLGYKMVQWLNAKPGHHILEPSAGHGAIGRFFPEDTTNTFIEPSYELSTLLKMNITGTVIDDTFESLHLWNKYHGIVMNPPFGSSGKLAEEHLVKAMKHMKFQNSRLIAIVPNGPSMQKRIDRIFENKEFKNHFISTEMILPKCVFSRAGTSVICKIIIIDYRNSHNEHDYNYHMDFSYCQSISQFFERIKEYNVKPYKYE